MIINTQITTPGTPGQVILNAGNWANVMFQAVAGSGGWICFGSNVQFVANATTVNTSNNTITPSTTTAHGLEWGQKVIWGGVTPPGGLTANAPPYFILPISPFSFQVCSTYENVIAGTPITLTTTGASVNTVRVQADNNIGIKYLSNDTKYFNAQEYPDICNRWTIYTPSGNDHIILLVTPATVQPYSGAVSI